MAISEYTSTGGDEAPAQAAERRQEAASPQASGNGTPAEASAKPPADLAVLGSQVVNTLREWYMLASDSITGLLDGRFLQQPARELWLLGKHYNIEAPSDEQGAQDGGYPLDVARDFARLIWCTYRSHYPPIADSEYTTDAGWGCMLRAGQTLMAQALQLHCFGRDWDISWDGRLDEDACRRRQYIGIVKQFFDDYSPTSTFSIHRMAAVGGRFQGKDIGEWFGPYGTARILRELALRAEHDVSVYTTTDGIVYLADICEKDFKPTLILVATMLGIDRVNPVYYPFIQASLMLPQSAGIAGGRPSSAMYFAGFQGDELLYLDPHYTRPSVARRDDNDDYSQADLATYSCNTLRRIPFGRLDPCMVFGYYCGSLESLVDLRSRIEMLADDGVQAIMSFDNGHSPETIQSEARPASSDEVAGPQQELLVKLPPSPGSGNTSRPRSAASSEFVLENEGHEGSEESWVVDL
ncbi:Cysteine protease atg4 [Coemansia sp. RSA 552]|nr:Cysteine protease atg4 [Coemansia sp. RSA 552]